MPPVLSHFFPLLFSRLISTVWILLSGFWDGHCFVLSCLVSIQPGRVNVLAGRVCRLDCFLAKVKAKVQDMKWLSLVNQVPQIILECRLIILGRDDLGLCHERGRADHP